jgi:hypothetical protein
LCPDPSPVTGINPNNPEGVPEPPPPAPFPYEESFVDAASTLSLVHPKDLKPPFNVLQLSHLASFGSHRGEALKELKEAKKGFNPSLPLSKPPAFDPLTEPTQQ